MSAQLPNPCDAFIELVTFLQAHRETQQATADMVYAGRAPPASWPPPPTGSPPTTPTATPSPPPGWWTSNEPSPTRGHASSPPADARD